MSAAVLLRCDCGADECVETLAVASAVTWEARMAAETENGWTVRADGDYAPGHAPGVAA